MKDPRSAGEMARLVPERFRGLGERQVLLNSPDLRFVNQSSLAKLTLALAGLLLEDVTLALMAAKHLARTGYLETLSNSLACLVNTTFAGHGGSNIHFFFVLASPKSNNTPYFLNFYSSIVGANCSTNGSCKENIISRNSGVVSI